MSTSVAGDVSSATVHAPSELRQKYARHAAQVTGRRGLHPGSGRPCPGCRHGLLPRTECACASIAYGVRRAVGDRRIRALLSCTKVPLMPNRLSPAVHRPGHRPSAPMALISVMGADSQGEWSRKDEVQASVWPGLSFHKHLHPVRERTLTTPVLRFTAPTGLGLRSVPRSWARRADRSLQRQGVCEGDAP